MELFRYARNPWGQEVLQGVSWDWLWIFAAAGATGILVHWAYVRFLAPKRHR